MAKYEVGITDINGLVRRLGYVSAILQLLEHKTLSESVLYTRLEKWSLKHKQYLDAYPTQRGYINSTDIYQNCSEPTKYQCKAGLKP